MSYFGLVGKQKLEWHFENPYDKLKVEDSYITKISFGQRALLVLPNSISSFYNKYLRNPRKDHSAAHAFMKITLKHYIEKMDCVHNSCGCKSENIDIYLDFDGSIHVSDKKYLRGNEKYIFEDQELKKNEYFLDFIEKLLEHIPEYHLTKQNCKKFSEKICKELFGEDSFQYKYLRFLHRRREV